MTTYYRECIEISKDFTVRFISYPLDKPFQCERGKILSDDLCNILKNPEDFEELYPGNKIFLGFGSNNPSSTYRFPVWIRPDLLTGHILIAGAIGSGKTSLTYRLIAGALKTFGTVVIGEAKSGTGGKAKGAAFTELALYLEKHLDERLDVHTYRWPRGNCWFNPLLYLKDKKDIEAFFQAVVQQIKADENLKFFMENAAKIASLVTQFMQLRYETVPQDRTVRKLVELLRNPAQTKEALIDIIGFHDKKKARDPKEKQLLQTLKDIKQQLEMSNFFYMMEKEFMGARAGVRSLANLLDDEDLLYYSEPHEKDRDGQHLKELKIDDLLYNRSLMIVSQPLDNPSSKIVGPLFWDALLSRVLYLGVGLPKNQAGKKRERIAVFLDETYQLPVGNLGDSGNFIRQFNVGLIEITPDIIDLERWNKNKNVWQTFISLSPPIDAVVDLIYSKLFNQPEKPLQPNITMNEKGLNLGIGINPNFSRPGQDNPGVSGRSLLDTGKRTALLMSNKVAVGGLFWIDLESELLAQFEPELDSSLLKDAISEKASIAALAAIDYALGLSKEFRV